MLKPCPFCGSDRDVKVETAKMFPNGRDHYVQCRGCASDGPFGKDEAEAVAKWNDRAATACAGGKFEDRPFGGEGDVIAVCSVCNQPAGSHQDTLPEERANVIEECAKVCDAIATAQRDSRDWMKFDDVTAGELAKRIRALVSPQLPKEPA